MSIHMAIIMDSIQKINIEKDSSLRLLLAAQEKKWHLYYMEPQDVFYEKGNVMGRLFPIKVTLDPTDFYTLSEPVVQPLKSLQVILMRQDPPCHSEYFYTTYLLEHAAKSGVLVVNNPRSLRDCNEKLFITEFPSCIPPTLVSKRMDQLQAFIQKEGTAILKPLDGMGGRSIFKVTHDDLNCPVILEQITQYGTKTIMAQKFIPEITQGDKRLLMIDGEPLPYVLVRVPSKNDFRGNIAAGGKVFGQALSKEDIIIAEQVGPVLKQKGLLFVGLDIIGSYLTEINITSPTCIVELEQQYQLNIAQSIIETINQKLQTH